MNLPSTYITTRNTVGDQEKQKNFKKYLLSK